MLSELAKLAKVIAQDLDMTVEEFLSLADTKIKTRSLAESGALMQGRLRERVEFRRGRG